jgi:hypothetical protein
MRGMIEMSIQINRIEIEEQSLSCLFPENNDLGGSVGSIRDPSRLYNHLDPMVGRPKP